MKTHSSVISNIVLCLVLVLTFLPGGAMLPIGSAAEAANSPSVPGPARVAEALQGGAVLFIENVGQFAEGARFQVRGAACATWTCIPAWTWN